MAERRRTAAADALDPLGAETIGWCEFAVRIGFAVPRIVFGLDESSFTLVPCRPALVATRFVILNQYMRRRLEALCLR